jgi:predicted  nucleic acid-binding Zn-ribbon protein
MEASQDGAKQLIVSEVKEAVSALLDLQEIDLTRDRLHERKERLPLKADLAEANSRIADVKAAIDRVQHEADHLEREEKRVEEEVRLIEEKIATEEDKMYSGRVVNPKELSALSEEVAMLKRKKAPLEETGLEELEARDQLLAERVRLEEELAELDKEADEIQSRIDAAVGELDRELDAEDIKRADVLAKIPDDAVEQYETLRPAKKGIGVGALQGGMCTACREALSAVEVDRIKRRARDGEWLFRCEHCRRLLVVT